MESSKKIKIGQVDVSSLENVTNKATNLTSPDNTKYPTTQAVVNGLALKADRADTPNIILNCNVLGLTVALSGGSGSVLYQKSFPINTFADLDTLEVESINEKLGTTSGWSVRIYVDEVTVFNIATARLLATSASFSAGNLFGTIKREFTVRGTDLKGLSSTIGLPSDEASNALASNVYSTTAFDPATVKTFYIVGTGSVSDSAIKQNFKITVMKNKS